jgi:hypothetical protein
MQQLRAQNETNIAANFLTDSTYNLGHSCRNISAPMPCFCFVQSHCEGIPAITRIRNIIGRDFCMNLPTKSVRRGWESTNLIAGVESTGSIPTSNA